MSASVEIVLPQDCSSLDMDELRRRMTDAPGQAERIVIDGSQVERIDGMVLQLLWCLRREVGGRLHWAGVSETLREAAACLGMEALFHEGE